MPMARPLMSATQKLAKLARSAAASAAITNRVALFISRPVIEAKNTPAAPARAPPTAQLTVASRSGDQPSALAARSSSAAATTARPKRVKRNTTHSTTVMSTAIDVSQMRSDCTAISPQCQVSVWSTA